MAIDYDGAPTFTFRFLRGVQKKEFPFVVPVMLYKEIFREGTAYAPGDCVTFGGSLWCAKEPTTAKPGDGSKSWQLAAKRGSPGPADVGANNPKPDVAVVRLHRAEAS
jgi:hypothetical protein